MNLHVLPAQLEIAYGLRNAGGTHYARSILHDVPRRQVEELADLPENRAEERADRKHAPIPAGERHIAYGCDPATAVGTSLRELGWNDNGRLQFAQKLRSLLFPNSLQAFRRIQLAAVQDREHQLDKLILGRRIFLHFRQEGHGLVQL